MTIRYRQSVIATAVVGALSLTSAHAQTPTPGYNTKIPEKIMTPDKVKTSIGSQKQGIVTNPDTSGGRLLRPDRSGWP
jgi:hypothetical protein